MDRRFNTSDGSAGMPRGVVDDPYGLFSDKSSVSLDELVLAVTARPANGAGAVAAAAAIDICPSCGNRMCTSSVSGSEYICVLCGNVVETEDDIQMVIAADSASSEAPRRPRLRIVGPGSRYYQRDLDRTSTTEYCETQKRNVRDSYAAMNWDYVEHGGLAFPENVLDLATELFHQIQLTGHVTRSQYKRQIMAACLYHICIEKQFVRQKGEVADFAGLRTRGIARGDDFLRKVRADGKVDVDVNRDICRPLIKTLFDKLGLREPRFESYSQAVEALVRKALAGFIGGSSNMRSKVAGATSVILSGAKNPRDRVTIAEIAEKFPIRRNTIIRFTAELASHHSHFVDIYRQYGITYNPE